MLSSISRIAGKVLKSDNTIFGVEPFYGFMDRDCPNRKSLELIQYFSDCLVESLTASLQLIWHFARPQVGKFCPDRISTCHFVTAHSGLPSSLRYVGLSLTTLRTTECVRRSHITDLFLDYVHLSNAYLYQLPNAFRF